jgi:hypothetical protein
MKWLRETSDGKFNRLENWHRYFAWHPCGCFVNESTQKIIWLEYVLRKGTPEQSDVGYWNWAWEYKEFELNQK